MGPAWRTCDLREDVGPTRAASGEREHVLFGHLGVHEQLPNDVRVWVAKQPLGHLPIRLASQGLSFTERQRPTAPVVGDPIFVRRRDLAVGGDRHGLTYEALERSVRDASRLLAQALNHRAERRILQGIDERNENLASRGLGLLGASAENLEPARDLHDVAALECGLHVGDAELRFGDRSGNANDRVSAEGRRPAQKPRSAFFFTDAVGAAAVAFAVGAGFVPPLAAFAAFAGAVER